MIRSTETAAGIFISNHQPLPETKTGEQSFFARHFEGSRHPSIVPFSLFKGDRLVLLGDSITEANRYSRIIETFLTVCIPELEVTVRNLGKGGDKADEFVKRLEHECLIHSPTAATLCYGMNDSGYMNDNLSAVDRYSFAIEAIVHRLKRSGVRPVIASPGSVGKLPPWPFISELKSTRDGINRTLMAIRDATARLSEVERLPFVDHFWNIYAARIVSEELHGPTYSVCGADDGVHNSWAGHVVFAYGYMKALGLDGRRGTFFIDLNARTATTDAGHEFIQGKEATYTFKSNRYPFCATGPCDKDWSIRSGMTLVPFHQELNRMILKVRGSSAARYRVSWMNRHNMLEEWHDYNAHALEEGVNLAEDFHLNPFSGPFNRIDGLIAQKQSVESAIIWRSWEAEGKPENIGRIELEDKRTALIHSIRDAFTPVTHNLRIDPLP